MNLKNSLVSIFLPIFTLALLSTFSGCGIYSMSGAATTAKTIQIEPLFNNTDLAPANLAQNFTNRLKDYYQQNSSLRVIKENGELQIEGIISQYALTTTSPTGVSPTDISFAAQTRLTIGVKINYVDVIEPKNSFKDRTFTFYKDFDNNLNFTTIQDQYERLIFDQIMIDIFNATVANW
jgi:hypothetical protein